MKVGFCVGDGTGVGDVTGVGVGDVTGVKVVAVTGVGVCDGTGVRVGDGGGVRVVMGQGFEWVMGQGFVKEKHFVQIQWDWKVKEMGLNLLTMFLVQALCIKNECEYLLRI